MKTSNSGTGGPPVNPSAAEGDKKRINVELWQSCAGPLVNLPAAGTHAVYFPQGHSEQVAASMNKALDSQAPNYPNLPPKLLCLIHNVTLHADLETDEVYAQMTLQPVPSFDKDALLRSELSMKTNKPQTEFFCKTLTASDTSTHGGFSVPRRAAEKIFPPLDFTMQPPTQELTARDLHDNVWTFRHIYRGQPKRHLLTTGWSLFVGGKRLIAGDSVLFIRDEKQQLLVGIRRANRQPANLSSSVLSSDSMHIGILAAAAHAAANNSPFTVFYNPRTSPSEFVIPLAKYYRAVCGNQISLGMRFRMMFETDESGIRRYMGTITGISDVDPVRWKNSQWRNLQVGWDESTTGERRNRVSIWEIEPVTSPFFICPTPPFFRSKRPRPTGMPDNDACDVDNLFRRTMPWLGDELGLKDPLAMPGLSLAQWMNMNMQQNPSIGNSINPNFNTPTSLLQNLAASDASHQLRLPQHNLQFNVQRSTQPSQQLDQLQNPPLNPLSSVMQQQQQPLPDAAHPRRQNLTGHSLPTNQGQAQILQSQSPGQAQHGMQPQQQTLLSHRNMSQTLPPQQRIIGQTQLQNLMSSSQPLDHASQQLQIPDNQIQLQLLHHQQQLLAQQSEMQQPSQPMQVLDSPNFSKSLTSQMLDASKQTPTMHPPSNVTGHHMTGNCHQTNHRFDKPSPRQPQTDMLSELPGCNPTVNQLSTGNGSVLTGAAGGRRSAVTDDAPSCSTSPSSNNCASAVQYAMSSRNHQTSEVKHSLNISKSQNQGFFASPTYPIAAGTQVDYLDSSSSATSVLSHNDGQFPPNNNSLSFNSQAMLVRDPRTDFSYGVNIDNQLGMTMMPDPPLIMKDVAGSGKDFSTYENTNDAQPELASSMVSQPFGVPDMAFNPIDDASFMNRGAWAPPQLPRMRTYTKVYKRGAVGRSIDITRYSGYDELKQDLARRFGIEGELEDRQRIGWKLVYVDHENDVLLVGDDPWEEFVNCARCIKILSPQEVQQMSLDGDLATEIIPNSSSNNEVN